MRAEKSLVCKPRRFCLQATTINRAQHIAEQLIAQGRFEHPFLGIEMITLTPQLKQEIISSSKAPIRIDEEDGVLVVRVVPLSPAARAGLRASDVLKKINNQPVSEAREVEKIVADTPAGSELNLEFKRQSQILHVTVQVVALPQAQARRK